MTTTAGGVSGLPFSIGIDCALTGDGCGDAAIAEGLEYAGEVGAADAGALYAMFGAPEGALETGALGAEL